MSSRLDRLFILLESGSTPFTRRAAANQLGEIQKLHPHELHHLLRRIYKLLHHTSWETRIASSQAVEAIFKHTPPWNPSCVEDETISEQSDATPNIKKADSLSLDMFDLANVLQESSYLTASQGNEYDMEEESNGKQQDLLQKFRQQLNSRLGFPLMDVADDLVESADLVSTVKQEPLDIKPNVSEVINSNSSMSTREINRARRKARQILYAKQKSNSTASEDGSTSGGGGPSEKKIKLEDTTDTSNNLYTNEEVPYVDGTWGNVLEWPLEPFCDKLCQDLFSPSWEIRHGVATALREILKIHGKGAGKYGGQTKSQMNLSNQLWLEDICVRFLCVIALDRFGDFISDSVVAPVRETTAQALGVVAKLLDEDRVYKVVEILLQMVDQKDWETRHGGLLGLKYILAVKMDLVENILPKCLPKILIGLCDPVDDVGNIAAATLIPVATHLVDILPNHVPGVVARLWKLLEEQDQLTSACNNFMSLLAGLISYPKAHFCLVSEPVMEVIPRLWPFLTHNTSSVRKATLQTMYTFTNVHNNLDCSIISLQSTLRHVFQRALTEHVYEIHDIVEEVWYSIITRTNLNVLLMAVCPYISQWLCLIMQPASVPFDSTQLITVKCNNEKTASSPSSPSSTTSETLDLKYYIGGVETVPLSIREENIIRSRYMACRMLGLLSTYVIKPMPGLEYTNETESPIECYVKVLLCYLNSKSALQRMVAGLVISDWNRRELLTPRHEPLVQTLHKCLEENIYYDELGGSYTKLLQDTGDLLSFLKHYKIDFEYDKYNKVLTLDEIEHVLGTLVANLFSIQHVHDILNRQKAFERLKDRQKSILSSAQNVKKEQFIWFIMVQAILAGASLQLKIVPQKINPIIKPLMDSIKFETNHILQELSGTHLAILIELCMTRTTCPNNKIITNLCTFLCCDPEFTPVIETVTTPNLSRSNSEASCSSGATSNYSEPTTPCTPVNNSNTSQFWVPPNSQNVSFMATSSSQSEHAYPKRKHSYNEQCQEQNSPPPSPSVQFANPPSAQQHNNNYIGILTLIKQQQNIEKSKKSNSSSGNGPGRPTLARAASLIEPLDDQESEIIKQAKIQCRGATFALKAIVKHFGEELPEKIPKLWEKITTLLVNTVNVQNFDTRLMVADDKAAETLVGHLQVFEVVAPCVHINLIPQLMDLQTRLCLLLTHPYRAVRHMASRCLAALACIDSSKVMVTILSTVVPLLAATYSDTVRQGAIEVIANILNTMQLSVVPFIVLLIVPLLARISDQDESVRILATSCFATCIELLPLDGAIPDPPNLTPSLLEQKIKQQHFITQLLDPKQIPDFKMPIEFNCELRCYQKSGINWLWFLNQYNLHGILCDDMGLGKTLQSICVLAADHYIREETYNKTQSVDCKPLPSIVVCPPTLTGHWLYEVKKFLPSKYLNPLQYAGTPQEREKLRSKMSQHNLIIASYDIVRKDVDVFSAIRWNYCILDEGHVIKNDKAKSTRAIKQLRANHRLILSGTPIQNNVLDLWSLFDFLMPGFLGTEKQFTSKYLRPILASRDPKASLKDQEGGVLAMEALHRQVLPLVLRRMKEDVLKDLPPKITQDYYCDLSPLQEKLYEDFAKIQNIDLNDKQTHVFQALRYLQSVCNHPKLILTPSHSQYTNLVVNNHINLNDIQHSAKLPALKQLLIDCGIGCPTSNNSNTGCSDLPSNNITQHRALIFCQLTAMIDILENDLFKTEMPSVTYLRLDGKIPAPLRYSIVTKFNNDPTIDILILTTQVGGLGLNLTGADTVIFVEHDWNPMKDLQAMDRAHRIGQKKVVNVYRLITRNTLEEEILNLQKFKLKTANTIINNENKSLDSMNTGKILDLFEEKQNGSSGASCSKQNGSGNNSNSASTSNSNSSGIKSLLDHLPDLWDEKEYTDEYDLTNFISNLNK